MAEILPLEKKIKKLAVIGYHAASTRAMFGGYTHMSMTERWLGAANTMAGMTAENTVSDEAVETYLGTYVQKEHPDAEDLAKRLKPKSNNLLEELRKRLPDTQIVYAFGYPHTGTDVSGHEEALRCSTGRGSGAYNLGRKIWDRFHGFHRRRN